MIRGPIKVIVLGPQGSGLSELAELFTTAIMSQGEMDMVRHVHAPTFRLEDGESEPIGPMNANILIKVIHASREDIENLQALWNDIKRAAK